MQLLLLVISTVFCCVLCSNREKCHELPSVPVSLQYRNFTDNNGDKWIFGKYFSPSFNFGMMYISLLQYSDTHGQYFAEYNPGDIINGNIEYSCKKYMFEDPATLFLYGFKALQKSYNENPPSLCEVCAGDIVFQRRLTDDAHTGADDTEPPSITENIVPSVCEKKNRYYFFR